MIEHERPHEYSPEQIIKELVARLDIRMELNYKFDEQGPSKQYGNTSDPDGEYEIRYNQGTLDTAGRSKLRLISMGEESPELIKPIISKLLNKTLPDDKPKYVLTRTETRYQMLTPEPSDDSEWSWVSGRDTKKLIDEIVLSFGPKALPYLETLKTDRSRELISKIKRQEFRKKIKAFFKSS